MKNYDVFLPPHRIEQRFEARAAQQIADWGHIALKASEVYDHTRGENCVCFIVDTGGMFDHPDLVENALNHLGKNFSDSPVLADIAEHATHVAGIIAAVDNEQGVIGIAPEAKVVPLKALNDSGQGFSTRISEAIRYAVEVQDPALEGKKRLINLSLGSSQASFVINLAIDYAIDSGCFVFAAAGNRGFVEGENTVEWPGRYEPVITVASIDYSGVPSWFSSSGEQTDLAAPGENIYSTGKNGSYVRMSGTSMATPMVTGLAALVLSHHPEIDNQKQLEEHLKKFATDIEEIGEDDRTGAGIPLAPDLLREKVEEPEPEPEPTEKTKTPLWIYLVVIGGGILITIFFLLNK